MTRRDRSRARWGWSAWAVVALAVALRLTVLPGYMLATGANTLAVTMCTADGVVSQVIDLGAAPAAPGKGDSEHPGKTSICAFAAAGVALTPLDAMSVASVGQDSPPVRLPFGAGLIGQGLAAPPPPPTGPPLSV